MKKGLFLLIFSGVFHANAGNAPTTGSVSEDSLTTHQSYVLALQENEDAEQVDITISGSIRNSVVLSLIDLRGKEYFHANYDSIDQSLSTSIPTEGIQPGVYYVKVASGDEIRLKTFCLH